MTIFNKAKDFAPVYQTPAGNATGVTPGDAMLSAAGAQIFSRGIYVGGAGHINVVMELNSATVQFASVQGGSLLPIRISRVQSSGTTATNIVAVW